MDKGQKWRTSEDEVALVKQFLESREDAPLVLRNHFLQFDLTEEEENFLQGINKDLMPVLVKMFTPVLDREIPLGQQASAYSRVFLDQMNPDVGELHLKANDIVKDYLEQRLNALDNSGASSEDIILEELPEVIEENEEFERVVNVIAFNLIVPIVEGRVQSLIDLVKPPEETPEEKAKREAMDSTK